MKHLFAIMLLSGVVFAQSYVSNFDNTENPISEGSHWLNASVTGLNNPTSPHTFQTQWNGMQISNGLAFGTQDGTANQPPFGDSGAVVTGNWNPVQTVMIAVHVNNDNQSPNAIEEVEIHLRAFYTSGAYNGYELNCRVGAGGAGYFNIGVTAGALVGTSATPHAGGGCMNGDLIMASMDASNNFHVSFWNSTTHAWVAQQLFNASGGAVSTLGDTTYSVAYCNAHPGQCLPGMGTYSQCNGVVGCGTSTNNTWGISQFIATSGTIRQAATCGSADVGAQLTAVNADGDVVLIPAGSCTWTSMVTYNQGFTSTIIGSTLCPGTPPSSCTDNTTITSNMTSDIPALAITTAANKPFRMTGMTLALSGAASFNGMVQVGGDSHQFRADHIHYKFVNADAINVGGNVLGMLDHSICDLTAGSTNDCWRASQSHWNDVSYDPGQWAGDGSWNDTTTLGSGRFLFAEDMTYNGGNTGGGTTFPFTNDCYGGGRFVLRNSVINGGAHSNEHGTGHDVRDRGCRAWEIYSNTWGGNVLPAAVPEVHFATSGTGVMWANNVTGAYRSFLTGHVNREDNVTYTQTTTGCPSCTGGFGYCGNAGIAASGSNIDQTNTGAGYACLDQMGRGQGDLLIGFWTDANGVQNQALGTKSGCSGQACLWPRQAIEPIYTWQNTWSEPSGWTGGFWANNDPGLSSNRDYFTGEDVSTGGAITTCPASPTGNCTAGVGVGTFANRPASCTVNSVSSPSPPLPINSNPGVGYWATDRNTLYVCEGSNNNWTTYYHPYAYPHPLDSSGFAAAPVQQVATPLISPNGGAFSSPVSVTLSDSTTGAAICYTTNGTTPTTNGAGTCTGSAFTYTGAFTVSVTSTVNAVGTLSGDTDSAVASATFTIGPQLPYAPAPMFALK